MVILKMAAGIAFVCLASGDVRTCACDVSNRESMAARECSLCREAEAQPLECPVFFLKDNNPRKPNRWLALPRAHWKGGHALAGMSPAVRSTLWTAAIQKSRELWGEGWGLAINGDESRTQCHMHVHIGKLLQGVETAKFIVVENPAQIPTMEDGNGLWVHPDGDKLHVHLGEQITETVLLR